MTMPHLIAMLDSPSTTTIYAAAMVMKDLGSSLQAIREPLVRAAIADGLAQAIGDVTCPRYIYVDNQRLELLDDLLFAVLLHILADDTQDRISEETIAESRQAEASLGERSGGMFLDKVERLQHMAEILQDALKTEVVEVVQPGSRILLHGDQQIEMVELDGVPQVELTVAINDAISQSQELVPYQLNLAEHSVVVVELSHKQTRLMWG